MKDRLIDLAQVGFCLWAAVSGWSNRQTLTIMGLLAPLIMVLVAFENARGSRVLGWQKLLEILGWAYFVAMAVMGSDLAFLLLLFLGIWNAVEILVAIKYPSVLEKKTIE